MLSLKHRVCVRVKPLLRSFRASPLLFVWIVGVPLCAAQMSKTPSAVASGFAVFSKVETTTVPTGIDLTVICTKPVAPGFTQLKDPERLVIDLPDTLVGTHPSSVAINGPDVRAMRINQFQKSPPVTRIVLDLLGERDYSYEANGNSFVVHLRGATAAAAKPSRPVVLVEGTVGLGFPQGAGKGAIILAGSRVAPGSAITAGGDTAILRLERGGEIRICPGTTASVTPSANGRSVMTGMSEGAVELHYSLASAADTVLTPDFRILLPGPGEFHYAISADPKGNTCVRALQGNTASAVVSELMGDGTYQVKPGEQVVFHSGRLTQTDANVPLECGCPPPRQPQLLTTVPVEAGSMRAVPASGDKPAPPPDGSSEPKPNSPVMVEVLALDPAKQQAPPQVVVDAPFVFRASDLPPAPESAKAPVATQPAAVPPRKGKKAKKEKPEPQSPPGQAKPPEPATVPAPKPAGSPAAKPSQPTTFFGKIKGFFRSIFK